MSPQYNVPDQSHAMLYFIFNLSNKWFASSFLVYLAPKSSTQRQNWIGLVFHRLLDYDSTFKNVKLQFVASNMILHVDSEAVYLVQDGTRSLIAGHYILISHLSPAPQIPRKPPKTNSYWMQDPTNCSRVSNSSWNWRVVLQHPNNLACSEFIRSTGTFTATNTT